MNNFKYLTDQILSSIDTDVLSMSAAFQGGLLLIVLAFSMILSRPVRAHLNEKIRTMDNLSLRLRDVMYSITRLVSVFFILIGIFISTKILGPAGLDINTSLLTIIGKLLFAWIIIRLSAQFIGNRAARNIFAAIVYAIAVMSIFGVLDDIVASLSGIGFSMGEFKVSALGVVKGVFALAAMLYGAMALAVFIDSRMEKAGFNPAPRLLISKILRIFLIICALLISITTAGIDLSVLAVFSGAVGLGIGFGLQRGASNLFSGMMLLMDQSIKPGDIIEVVDPAGNGTAFGWVKAMGGRHTEIITRDNKSYLIPNEQLITQQVVNWSHGDTLVRIETKFGVHYKSDPHLIRKLAVVAATLPERVEKSPAPVCHLTEFGDSSLNFVLRFWVRDAENGITNVKGEVMLALWDTFKENGITIPYPQREVTLLNPS